MNKLDPVARMRANVVVREDGRCFRCGKQVAFYTDETYHDLPQVTPVADFTFHHRKPLHEGNDLDVDIFPNLMLLCGKGDRGCVGWVKSHRDEAHKDGLLLDGVLGSPLITPAFREYDRSWIDLCYGTHVANFPETDISEMDEE
ncbi:HNH endonuclease [Mobiluncus curtisii]|uniref:HNH endonuclease n=1 Tax=Mobiluncus curtisii ATCC 51333 TaxID=887326 RepID=E6M138_9ACTO|nr:hypothetical protein [Mobiluncus curtisii]EFU79668.1 hypothetical protein HMPREF0388_1771 [Mobiluncus curtisii ATCC 51333]